MDKNLDFLKMFEKFQVPMIVFGWKLLDFPQHSHVSFLRFHPYKQLWVFQNVADHSQQIKNIKKLKNILK